LSGCAADTESGRGSGMRFDDSRYKLLRSKFFHQLCKLVRVRQAAGGSPTSFLNARLNAAWLS
jgi:hypothetical protein